MHHRRPLFMLSLRSVAFGGVWLIAACGSSTLEPEDAINVGSVASALGSLVEVTGFGANPGALKMYEYAPASLGAKPAVVVVLHGCQQGAADVAKTGWNELADKLGFVVVYPEQSTTNNSAKCFNWGGNYGDLTNIQRGKDENQSIKEMVDKTVTAHGADTKRVFVAGFSAGGGQAAVMAATWPDVFAAAATIAGLPYHCNATYVEAFTCMKPGLNKTPAQWAALVREGYSGYSGAFPRMSIWQGANDTIVAPANRTELVEQWTEVHGSGQTAATTDTVNGASHSVFKDGSGKIVVETYEVPGMDHGVAVDPAHGCGTAGSYALDKGICTAGLVIKFFGLDGAVSGADGGASSSSSSGSSGGASGKPGSGASSSSSGTGTGTGTNAAPKAGGEPGSAASTCAFRPRSSAAQTWGFGILAALAALVGARRSKTPRGAGEGSSRGEAPRTSKRSS